MKKVLFIMLIGMLLLPMFNAQEKKEAALDMLKNLQLVEKPEVIPQHLRIGLNHINAREMMALLTFLSSDNLEGRETGTRGYDTAAAYAVSLFSLWGLKPGGDNPKSVTGPFRQMGAEVPAAKSERGYLQELELKEAVEISANASLEIIRPGGAGKRTLPFSQETDFIFNSSLPVEISAPVVFAGYGISEKSIAYDDLKGLDIRDRIVMILSDAPGKDDSTSPFQKKEIKEKYFPAMSGRVGGPDYTKAADILKRGALAVLIVKNSLADGDIYRDILGQQQIRDDKPILPDSRKKVLLPGAKPMPWEGNTIIKISREMANAILANTAETVESLQKKISANYKPQSIHLPGTSLQISNHVRYQLLKSANVVAFIEGNDPQLKNQAVIIGAHLDHLGRRGDYIYNGAEDNASGTVGVLAIARALAANPEKPKRSVVFCLWSGEEVGLLGSRYYVEHPLYSLENTLAYINLDMIAQPWDEKGLRRMLRMMNIPDAEALLKKIKPENFLFLSHAYDSVDLKNALLEANRHIGFDIFYREAPKSLERMMAGSDHAAFAMAAKPWAFFMTGMSDIYHTPADSMEKFSGATMEKVSRLIYLAAFNLADK